DSEANVLLGATGDNYLRVWDLAAGTLSRAIALPGFPVQVMPEDTNRCYVMTSNGMICLVNYAAGALVSAFRFQSPTFSPFSSYRAITWDRKYRRFLQWTYTPVDTTGQNTSIITGYFPLPIAVGITKPIPLKPPRKYRSTPIYNRIF